MTYVFHDSGKTLGSVWTPTYDKDSDHHHDLKMILSYAKDGTNLSPSGTAFLPSFAQSLLFDM